MSLSALFSTLVNARRGASPRIRLHWSGLGLLCLLLAGMAAGPQPASAQAPLLVEDPNVVYIFGEQITFQGRFPEAAQIVQASVLFRQAQEELTRVESLVIEPDGSAHFTYNASLNVLAPFSTVLFWFQAAFTDGSTRSSAAYSFRYDDNRFPWQELWDADLTVHWYDGNTAFGQAALDVAREGVSAIGELLALEANGPLDIYIYSNVNDLQGALYLGGREWVAGHADPALGVALVAIPPGETQTMEMQTTIPHEAAHVLLYRGLGPVYDNLPAWLSEGIASLAEAYPNPDYSNALDAAGRGDSLIPLLELCDSFPPDSGRAFLAYAQSRSFTAYLRDTYGVTGLNAFVHAYADGLDCDLGAVRAVGLPLSQLDSRWRETSLGQNAAGAALRDLAPYLIVLGMALLIPLTGFLIMLFERRQRGR